MSRFTHRWKLGVAPVALAVIGATMVSPQRARAQDGGPADPTADAVHLLQRATFGATPESLDELLDLGIEGWLDRQLDPEAIDDSVTRDLISERFPKALMRPSELLEQHPPGQIIGTVRQLVQDSAATPAERRAAREVLRGSNPAEIAFHLTGARLTRAAHSERQLEEVMTQFWFDHFNVDFRKNQVRWLAADYEDQAIRPNVFGSFYDLLVATASHPAMLVYLDNAQSVAPDSVRAEQTASLRRLAAVRGFRGGGAPPPGVARPQVRPVASRGLNENYARELLELHTLGVDGGYTQEDVIEVARAFSGWSVSPPGFDREALQEIAAGGRPDVGEVLALLEGARYDGALEFAFRMPMHDFGDKFVLGREIEGSRGTEDALAVLELLATHPATARHIATQLVTRFVSDDPPAKLVDEIARVFLDTDGDLAAVTRALFTSEEFYAEEHRSAKTKSPVALVASAVRATDAEILDVRPVSEILEALGEVPYRVESPAGYPEDSSTWVSGGTLLGRMEFGSSLAAGDIPGIDLPDPPPGLAGADVAALAEALFPAGAPEDLLATIGEVLAEEGLDGSDATNRTLGLLLGSPDFQNH